MELEVSMRRNILVLKWSRKKEGRIEDKLDEGNAERVLWVIAREVPAVSCSDQG